MTKFLDGPAEGALLTIRRCPLYLRAVQGTDGKWDALDQLDDVAAPGETLVAYRRVGEAGVCLVDWTEGGRRRGGSFATGEYRVVEGQPDQKVMADNTLWRQWCQQQGGG